jgi:hypothetical protein
LIIQINYIKSIDKNDHDVVDYTHLAWVFDGSFPRPGRVINNEEGRMKVSR